MTVLQGRTRRWLLLLTAVAAAACNDSVSPRQVKAPIQPAKTISDGAHSGGNDDVFFLPPMVSNPNGAAGYGDPFAPNLPVTIKVVCIVAPDGSCNGSQVVANLPATMDASNQMYMVNWDTKASSLNDNNTYQIQVWVNKKQIAYADVDPVPNASQLKNISSQDTIGLVDGRTLPIKVRIEQGWACADRQSKLCTTQVVGNTTVGSPVTVIAPDSLAAGQFEGNWIPFCTSTPTPGCVPQGTQVVVTVEDQTNLLAQSPAPGIPAPTCSLISDGVPKTQMLSDSHCVKFTTDPAFKFASPVKVAVCVHSDELTQQLLKYDYNETPRFLENVPFLVNNVDFTALCETATGTQIGSRSSNKILNYALNALSAMGRGLRSLVVPQSAYAIHTGVGGLVDSGDGFSFVSPARPLTMSISAGDGQSAPVNTAVPIAPRVQIASAHGTFDLESGFPNPLMNLQVQCVINPGSGSFSATPAIAGTVIVDAQHATALTDANGVATCPSWVLAATGPNQLTVSYAKIDNGIIAVEDTPSRQEVVLHNNVTFTATGTQATIGFVSVTTSDGQTAFDGSTLSIEGPIVNYIATIQNPGSAIGNGDLPVVLQNWIQQGKTRRAAGGTDLTCASLGILPNGTCVQNWGASANDIQNSGTGTFTAGSATLVIELWSGSVGGGTLLATKSIPITLTGTSTAPGTIQGHVLDATGAPIANVQVSAFFGDAAPYTATTDATGFYQMTRLPPTVYSVSISVTGYSAPSQQVTVAPGGTTTVDFSPSVVIP